MHELDRVDELRCVIPCRVGVQRAVLRTGLARVTQIDVELTFLSQVRNSPFLARSRTKSTKLVSTRPGRQSDTLTQTGLIVESRVEADDTWMRNALAFPRLCRSHGSFTLSHALPPLPLLLLSLRCSDSSSTADITQIGGRRRSAGRRRIGSTLD